MTRKVMFEFMAILVVVLLAPVVAAQEPQVLKTDKEKESYAIGVDLARNLRRQGIEAETEAMLKGMRDVFTRSELLLTEEDLQVALSTFQTEMKLTRARAARYVQDLNKTKGDAFRAENKMKEGVVTLPSGLQYKVLREGYGKKPTATDTVEINYRGTLIDGTEFDSSYSRRQSTTLKVSGVIKGWEEALQLMPAGSKWELVIPPELAYGANGRSYGKRVPGLYIGPYETLIFELELVSIH